MNKNQFPGIIGFAILAALHNSQSTNSTQKRKQFEASLPKNYTEFTYSPYDYYLDNDTKILYRTRIGQYKLEQLPSDKIIIHKSYPTNKHCNQTGTHGWVHIDVYGGVHRDPDSTRKSEFFFTNEIPY